MGPEKVSNERCSLRLQSVLYFHLSSHLNAAQRADFMKIGDKIVSELQFLSKITN